MLFLVVQFSAIHDRVEALLQRNGSQMTDFVIPLVTSIPYLLSEVRGMQAAVDIVSFVYELYFMFLQLGNTIFFLIIDDIIIALQKLLLSVLVSIEEKVPTTDSTNTIRDRQLKAKHPVIWFREDWNLLKNGCFNLSSENFLSYLATCVTCTAVTLQFDRRVSRFISGTTNVSSMQ